MEVKVVQNQVRAFCSLCGVLHARTYLGYLGSAHTLSLRTRKAHLGMAEVRGAPKNDDNSEDGALPLPQPHIVRLSVTHPTVVACICTTQRRNFINVSVRKDYLPLIFMKTVRFPPGAVTVSFRTTSSTCTKLLQHDFALCLPASSPSPLQLRRPFHRVFIHLWGTTDLWALSWKRSWPTELRTEDALRWTQTHVLIRCTCRKVPSDAALVASGAVTTYCFFLSDKLYMVGASCAWLELAVHGWS